MVLKSQQRSPTTTTTTEGRTSSSYETMSSSENLPPLALSDIMHPMSPSPVLIEDTPDSAAAEFLPNPNRNLIQEPLTDSDVFSIQKRLQEMGLVLSSSSENGQTHSWSINVANTASSRERELTEMIVQLTNCPRIDPAQLEEQAATIALLITQRDLFVAQAEEERLQWRSQRESWDRTAEALLTQKTRPLKAEDLDSQRVAYESEIKILRDKLHDRHRRLSALEQEILRLKPLLLMQPYSTSLLKQTIASQHQSTKVHDKGKRREVDSTPSKTGTLRSIPEENDDHDSHSPKKFDTDSYPYGYQYKPEESSFATLPSSSAPPPFSHPFLFESPTVPDLSSQRRKSKDHSSNNKSSKKQKQQRVPSISSDAYAEHVLLAAQKIGRKRAAYVTGLQKLADREKEFLAREQEQIQTKKEQERLEKERLGRLASGMSSTAYYRPSTSTSPQRGTSRSGSTPSSLKTPKRGGYSTFGVGPTNNANPGGVNTPTPSTYVFVNTSATPIPKCSVGQSPGNVTNPGAPLALGSGMRSTHVGLTSNPPTPLDSLVDAARMMGENGDRPIGRRRPLEEPESPTAKRRRVSTDKSLVNRSTSRFGRVRSALDVLADQAAAVNEPGPAAIVLPGGKNKYRAKGQGIQSKSTKSSAKSGRLPAHRQSGSPAGTLSTGGGLAKTAHGRQSRSAAPGPRVIARPMITPDQYPFTSQKVARVGPVVGWGNRSDLDDEDEDEEEEEESIPHSGYDRSQNTGLEEDSRTRDVDDFVSSHPRIVEMKGDIEQVTIAAKSPETTNTHPRTDGPSTESAARTTLQELPSQEYARSQRRPFSRHTSRDRSQEPAPTTHSSPNPLPTPKSDYQFNHNEGAGPDDIQAEDDEDEDAEGEEEEGTEGEVEAGSRSPRSRSRSPPPPDPPPPGSDGGAGPDEGHDPDADAEGEMDVDDSGAPDGSAMISSPHQSRTGHLKNVLFFLEILHSPFRVGPANICYLMPAIYSMIQLLTLSNHCFSFVSTISRCLPISCTMPWHTHQFEEGIESLRSGLREGDRYISYAESCQSNIGNSSNESCRQLANNRSIMKYLEYTNYGRLPAPLAFLTPSDSLLVASFVAHQFPEVHTFRCHVPLII